MINSEIYYNWLQKKFTRKINLKLSRIKSFLKKENIDVNKIKGNIIQIAGSDGKNAVLQSLLSILLQNKKKVSTYTSPSIISPLDRIQINGKFITLKNFKKLGNYLINSKTKLTLFEALTLIYILTITKLKDINCHLVEAGAGFAKDSTNLWSSPKIQAITNINKQHLDLFGVKTINDICKIKVGSLSKNTNIYIGRQDPKVLKIIRKILKKNPSKKVYYGKDFKILKHKKSYIFKDKKGKLRLKANQIHSQGLWEGVALAVKIARDLGINNKVILKALPKIIMKGRIEYIYKGNLRKHLYQSETLICDGAHSLKSALNLKSHLSKIKQPLYGIFGIQKNRYPDIFIKQFKGMFNKIITVKIPHTENSISAEKLNKICKKNNFNSESAASIIEAFKKISSKKPKTIVVFGSLYLSSALLKLN